MGKIKKIRELKKIEAEQKRFEKKQKNKKIILSILGGLAVLIILIYGLIKIINQNNNTNTQATPSPSNSSTPSFSFLPSPSSNEINLEEFNKKIAVVKTPRGEIEIELYPSAAPQTVANFVKLTNNGFYNNLTFHRVVPGFVIQGGDPKGDGTGGPGYTFADEINPWSLGLSEKTIAAYQAQGYTYRQDLISHKMEVGAVAMANSGPNTNGSQFFIVTDKDQPHLDGKHTVFGKVIKGLEVARQIKQGDKIEKIYFKEKTK